MRTTAVLKRGGVIAYPTDTVYGLGADATNTKAIAKVYAIKGRDFRKPLSIAVSSVKMLGKCAKIGKREGLLIKSLWKAGLFPGPTTLLLRKKNLPSILTNGSPMVGIRIPASKACLSIVKNFDRPITSTSANPSGMRPAKSHGSIDKSIREKVDIVVKGKCAHGKESTIIDSRLMAISRKGARWKEVERVLDSFT